MLADVTSSRSKLHMLKLLTFYIAQLIGDTPPYVVVGWHFVIEKLLNKSNYSVSFT